MRGASHTKGEKSRVDRLRESLNSCDADDICDNSYGTNQWNPGIDPLKIAG